MAFVSVGLKFGYMKQVGNVVSLKCFAEISDNESVMMMKRDTLQE